MPKTRTGAPAPPPAAETLESITLRFEAGGCFLVPEEDSKSLPNLLALLIYFSNEMVGPTPDQQSPAAGSAGRQSAHWEN